jgi:hypothetical protein
MPTLPKETSQKVTTKGFLHMIINTKALPSDTSIQKVNSYL